MRRNDVTSTSFRRHVPTRFLINQCQIITFFILKSDRKFKRIESNTNSRELKAILYLLLFYPSLGTFVIFFLFHIEIEENVGGLLGGQRVCWPPSQITGGAWPPWPPIFLRLWFPNYIRQDLHVRNIVKLSVNMSFRYKGMVGIL